MVDFFNQLHRSCIGFGPPRKHFECTADCKHEGKNFSHCLCGARRNEEDKTLCYGEKYTFIFNFFRNLRPLVEDGAPNKIFACLEGYPKFRYDLFPNYKANRITKQGTMNKEQADKFQATKDEVLRLLQFLPITIAHAQHYEADDLIATLSENMKEEDLTIITNDKDYLQLLQKDYQHITIYNPIKKEAMVAPDYLFIPYLSLIGDKSDNIPRLMSEKKALQHITNPPLFKTFMGQEENRARFAMNKALIEFRQVPEEEIILQEGTWQPDQLKVEFDSMDFQSIINEKSWKKYTETFDAVRY